jgi:hypothetical protein
MRPGKMFRLHAYGTALYQNDFTQDRPQFLEKGTTVFVVSVKPDAKIVKWHDLHMPWLVIADNTIGLIDINNLPLEDISPL